MTTRAQTLAARPEPAPGPVFRNISTVFLESIGPAVGGPPAEVYVHEVADAYAPAVEAGLLAMPAVVARSRIANDSMAAFPNPQDPPPWEALGFAGAHQREAALDRAGSILYGEAARGEVTTGALDWFVGERDRLFRDWAAHEIRHRALAQANAASVLAAPPELDRLAEALAERLDRAEPLVTAAGDAVDTDPILWLDLSAKHQASLRELAAIAVECEILWTVAQGLVEAFGTDLVSPLLCRPAGESGVTRLARRVRELGAATAARTAREDPVEPGPASEPVPVPVVAHGGPAAAGW